jgi:hypothetical protein
MYFFTIRRPHEREAGVFPDMPAFRRATGDRRVPGVGKYKTLFPLGKGEKIFFLIFLKI